MDKRKEEISLYNKDIKEVVDIIKDNDKDKTIERHGLILLAEFNQRIVDLFNT